MKVKYFVISNLPSARSGSGALNLGADNGASVFSGGFVPIRAWTGVLADDLITLHDTITQNYRGRLPVPQNGTHLLYVRSTMLDGKVYLFVFLDDASSTFSSEGLLWINFNTQDATFMKYGINAVSGTMTDKAMYESVATCSQAVATFLADTVGSLTIA